MTDMYAIWPSRMIDSEMAWQKIVSNAREDMKAGQPVQDYDLTQVDPDARADLKIRRHILEWDLGCTGCVRFEGE